jgi:hypothetical protein
MSQDALHSYLLWFPRVDRDGALVVNATQAEQTAEPVPSASFMRGLVETFRLAARPRDLKIVSCRSRYFGEEHAENWEDVWPLVWRLQLVTEPPLKETPVLKHEMIGTTAFDLTGMDKPKPRRFKCLIIGDFESTADADRCRDRLQSSDRLERMRKEDKYQALEFERIIIRDDIVQEQIDAGSFPTAFFRKLSDYVMEIEKICRECNGIMRSEERISERDEAYNPAGIE